MKWKWLIIDINLIALILLISTINTAIKTTPEKPVLTTPTTMTRSMIFVDSFETYQDFIVDDFSLWTTFDGDGGQTKGMENADWPNEYYTGSFMIFNPAQTIPPLNATYYAHTGLKYMSCWDTITAMAPNNDWLFTPQLAATTYDTVSLWARSLDDQNGLEDFEIGISTTDSDPTSFTIIQVNNDVPVEWTQYTLDISGYSGQFIYIGIHVFSYDVLAFGLDDFEVTGTFGPCDDIPPVTICTLEGTFDGNIYTSDVTVILSATDDWSGVNKTKYRLDEGTWTDYAEAFMVTEDGLHSVLFYSIDNAGNQEAEKNSTFLLQQKSLINITIKGGFGISATIKNTGTTNFTNIDWTITQNGKYIFTDKNKSGTIMNLASGASVPIKDFIIGFGSITINMTVEPDNTPITEVTKTAFLLGPFVIIKR